MGLYERALDSKALASDIVLPLIEFEFCFCGDEQVKLVQSAENAEQTLAMFNICNVHGWVKGALKRKGNRVSFSLSKKGFSEIYSLSGPMFDRKKDEWAKLLVERKGRCGGRRIKNQNRPFILKMLEEGRRSVSEICRELRIQPSSVRTSLRSLVREGLISFEKNGKKRIYFWLNKLPEYYQKRRQNDGQTEDLA